MLFNLKKEKKPHRLKHFAGAYSPKFTPLNIPSYKAGYLMNTTTDNPAGSINPLYIQAQWFDAKILGIGSKLMQRGSGTVTGLVNGFKCENIDTSNGRLRNVTTDIFNGVTNFSYVLGFKRNVVGAGHMIQAVRNDADTIGSYSLLQNDGKLRLTLASGAVSADAVSISRYDDNAWHAIVCLINQTTKTVRLITDTGEDVSNTDALLPAPIALTNTNQSYCQLGAWWVASLNFTPGFLGDVVFFNSILTASEIVSCMEWEKSRLAI